MRKKIGTALHEHLVMHLKELARTDGVPFNELLEEAIGDYLAKRARGDGPSFLERTRGSVRLPPQLVEEVLAEDPYVGE